MFPQPIDYVIFYTIFKQKSLTCIRLIPLWVDISVNSSVRDRLWAAGFIENHFAPSVTQTRPPTRPIHFCGADLSEICDWHATSRNSFLPCHLSTDKSAVFSKKNVMLMNQYHDHPGLDDRPTRKLSMRIWSWTQHMPLIIAAGFTL